MLLPLMLLLLGLLAQPLLRTRNLDLNQQNQQSQKMKGMEEMCKNSEHAVMVVPQRAMYGYIYLLELSQLSWLAHILKMLLLNKLAMDPYLFEGGHLVGLGHLLLSVLLMLDRLMPLVLC